MSDSLTSTISFICSFTSLAVSLVAFSLAAKTYNSVIKTQQDFNLQRMKAYNRRQREYVKAVCAGELGKPEDN